MKTVEPQELVIEYRESVYLCSKGEHEARRVYLWRGKWYCRECLNRTVRAHGAAAREATFCASSWIAVGRPEFRAEAVKCAAPLERITARNDVPRKPKR